MKRGFDGNIVLIGFMGVGKSTVAAYLGRLFGMPVVEMDQAIADQEQMSIPRIFETYGETYFRDKETELLIKLNEREHRIISCGGGAPLREKNVNEMKKKGKVVLLTASPQAIYERVREDSSRPLLAGRKTAEDIAGLMEQRREKYEAAADIVIHTDNKTISQIGEEVAKKLSEMGEAYV